MKDHNGDLTRKAYPFEFWVNKTAFIEAVLSGMSNEQIAAMNNDPKVTIAISLLPGDELDILDAKVAAFLAMAGTDVNMIMEKMGLEFPPDPTVPKDPEDIFL